MILSPIATAIVNDHIGIFSHNPREVFENLWHQPRVRSRPQSLADRTDHVSLIQSRDDPASSELDGLSCFISGDCARIQRPENDDLSGAMESRADPVANLREYLSVEIQALPILRLLYFI